MMLLLTTLTTGCSNTENKNTLQDKITLDKLPNGDYVQIDTLSSSIVLIYKDINSNKLNFEYFSTDGFYKNVKFVTNNENSNTIYIDKDNYIVDYHIDNN